MTSASGFLGAIERQVGAPHQLLFAVPIERAHGNPDCRTDVQGCRPDRDAFRQMSDDLVGNCGEARTVGRGGPDDGKFIAANAPDAAAFPDRGFKAAADFDQQLVPDRMAERVIDQFEPVEVDEKQRAFALPFPLRQGRFFQQFPNQQPVGESG